MQMKNKGQRMVETMKMVRKGQIDPRDGYVNNVGDKFNMDAPAGVTMENMVEVVKQAIDAMKKPAHPMAIKAAIDAVAHAVCTVRGQEGHDARNVIRAKIAAQI